MKSKVTNEGLPKPETISVEHILDVHQKPEEASSFYISPTNNPFHKHFGLSQIRINLCDTKTIFIPLDVNITWICFYRINHQKVWSSQQKQSSRSTGLWEESLSSRGMRVTISYQGEMTWYQQHICCCNVMRIMFSPRTHKPTFSDCLSQNYLLHTIISTSARPSWCDSWYTQDKQKPPPPSPLLHVSPAPGSHRPLCRSCASFAA